MRVYGGYLLNIIVLNVDGEYVRYTFPNPLLNDEEERLMKGNSRSTRAVTVDWVVLTAAIVGLGVAAMTSVSGGTTTLPASIAPSLATDMSKTVFHAMN
tara:strand:+ start:781 stop:1077 length:297 start_codon:yes stop_codon:yes gene_type:complete